MEKVFRKKRSADVNWEEEYRTAKKRLWRSKPHTFSRLARQRVPVGKVMDIGSGEGYDCLYFARAGYQVTALDISSTTIKTLLSVAREHHLMIRGHVQDIKKFPIRSSYDIFVSYGVLQFLGRKFKRYLLGLKKKTVPGGVHAFYIFGNKGDFYSLAKHRFHFPSEKELRSLYADWKILKFKKKNTRLLIRGDHGETLYNSMFKILVQKPKI